MADETKSDAGTQGAGSAGADGKTSQTSALGDEGGAGGKVEGKVDAKGTALTDGAEGEKKDAKGKGEEKPAELKLKLPEGFDAKDATYGKFLAAATKGGLKPEVAQELLDVYVEQQKASVEKALADHDAEQAEWRDLLKSDKEYGGEKYDASLALARKAMAKYATPAFRQFLRDSGLGNHPELFRFVRRVGAEMADDSIGTTGGASGAKPKSLSELLYSSTTAKPKES
jgi:hypothetical protein